MYNIQAIIWIILGPKSSSLKMSSRRKAGPPDRLTRHKLVSAVFQPSSQSSSFSLSSSSKSPGEDIIPCFEERNLCQLTWVQGAKPHLSLEVMIIRCSYRPVACIPKKDTKKKSLKDYNPKNLIYLWR